jgi:hypothetical protein
MEELSAGEGRVFLVSLHLSADEARALTVAARKEYYGDFLGVRKMGVGRVIRCALAAYLPGPYQVLPLQDTPGGAFIAEAGDGTSPKKP